MERVSIDMPQGDGNPECPYCKGRGVVPVPPELRPRFSIGDILTPCFCVKERDIRMNIKRAWPVLEHVKPVKKTPLKGFENKNLWVTASDNVFQPHMYRVMMGMPSTWFVRVVTDVKLMNAWLSRDIPTDDMLDPEVAWERQRGYSDRVFQSLSNLTDPPQLLVISIIKTSRNSAMPEVLLEAFQTRKHEGKPTWVIDDPLNPLRMGHISYSDDVIETLSGWEHLELSEGPQRRSAKAKAKPMPDPKATTNLLGTVEVRTKAEQQKRSSWK